jgi:excinuclease ABC subunit C
MTYSPATISTLPEIPGVYQYYDKTGKILYVGKAKNLKKRVSSYFHKRGHDAKTTQLVQLIESIEIIPVESEFDALNLEARLINQKKPHYNIILKDDKHYLYIKITDEEFPLVTVSRKEDDKKALFFGPYPSSQSVKVILRYLRHIFPYCSQKRPVKKPCFYTHIGLCYPCPGEIIGTPPEIYAALKRKYRLNIKHIKDLLQDKRDTLQDELVSQMKDLSKEERYEEAAFVRDTLNKIDYLVHHFDRTDEYMDNPDLARQTWLEEQRELTETLAPYFPNLTLIHRIECYDVSNISGQLSVGAMVTFIDGEPVKGQYRKFRLKTTGKPDDFAMHSEMMTRRLKHVGDWSFPELFVIDGGKPQLVAIYKVMGKAGVTVPVVGLAKEEEEIVVPKEGDFLKLRLPRNSRALRLIQRLRDESHRFAHNYHEQLRMKKLLMLRSQ